MGLPQILAILGIAAAGLATHLVLIAWQARFVRMRLMTTCLALGLVASLLGFLFGGALPLRADSLDFVRGLSLGLGIGLFLGSAVLFLVETVERKRKTG